MTDPRLSEFSLEELQELLNVVVSALITKRLQLENLVEMFKHTDEGYPYAAQKQKEIDRLDLFKVQILNAIVKVKMQEIVNSN